MNRLHLGLFILSMTACGATVVLADPARGATIVVRCILPVGLVTFLVVMRSHPKIGRDAAPWLTIAGACYFLVTLFVALVWDPILSNANGPDPNIYDSVRFYYWAEVLASRHFAPDALPPYLNYTGIVYYYAGAITLVGRDSYSLAVLNAAIAVGCVFYLARNLRAPTRSPARSTSAVGLLLLLPETIWTLATASREAPILALSAVFVAGVVRLLTTTSRFGRPLSVTLASMAGVGLLRLSLVPVMVGAAAAALGLSRLRRHHTGSDLKRVVAAVSASVVLLVALPTAVKATSSKVFTFDAIFRESVVERSVNDTDRFSDKSIGHALKGSGPLSAAVLAPLRATVYYVAPLPARPPAAERRPWVPWIYLAGAGSSLVFLLFLPAVLAVLISSARSVFNTREARVEQLIVSALGVVMLLGIGFGTTIIESRYRIAALPPMAAAAWHAAGHRLERQRLALLGVTLTAAAALLGGYLLFKGPG